MTPSMTPAVALQIARKAITGNQISTSHWDEAAGVKREAPIPVGVSPRRALAAARRREASRILAADVVRQFLAESKEGEGEPTLTVLLWEAALAYREERWLGSWADVKADLSEGWGRVVPG